VRHRSGSKSFRLWSALEARRRIADERGAAAVEFAIVVSLFFLLVFGIIDFGMGFQQWNATSNAAREGARKAAVDPSVADIEARVRQSVDYLDQSRISVTITCAPGGGPTFGPCPSSDSWAQGDIVKVTVDYSYRFITPLGAMIGMGSSMNLHADSEVRFEG
jgi:Flp pilus assembly protein TadG